MAQYETREVASYLRDGSVWIGHFVVSEGDLNFGDDRFDSANGLANFLCDDPTNSINEVQAWSRLADRVPDAQNANGTHLNEVVERLKLAA